MLCDFMYFSSSMKLNSVCSAQSQYLNLTPMLWQLPSQVLNVIGQHRPSKSLIILRLQSKFAYFQYFHFPKRKQIQCLQRMKKQTMNRTSEVTPSTHSAGEGVEGGEETF